MDECFGRWPREASRIGRGRVGRRCRQRQRSRWKGLRLWDLGACEVWEGKHMLSAHALLNVEPENISRRLAIPWHNAMCDQTWVSLQNDSDGHHTRNQCIKCRETQILQTLTPVRKKGAERRASGP